MHKEMVIALTFILWVQRANEYSSKKHVYYNVEFNWPSYIIGLSREQEVKTILIYMIITTFNKYLAEKLLSQRWKQFIHHVISIPGMDVNGVTHLHYLTGKRSGATSWHIPLVLNHGAHWFSVPLHALRHSKGIHGCALRDSFRRQNWHLWKSHRHGTLEIHPIDQAWKTHNIIQGKSLSLICGSLRWLKDQEAQGGQQPVQAVANNGTIQLWQVQSILLTIQNR